jgi:hypothetical protein
MPAIADLIAASAPPSCSCIELWELHPPAPSQQQQQQQQQLSPPQQQQQQQEGGQHDSAYPTTDGGRFAVRVLYNQQELPLPDCPPDRLMGLATFESELLGSFLLGEQEHAQVGGARLVWSGGGPHCLTGRGAGEWPSEAVLR